MTALWPYLWLLLGGLFLGAFWMGAVIAVVWLTAGAPAS